MFKKHGILFLYSETPLHWGAGSSVGPIDLPIQRERHTGYPMGQGGGIKGSLRDFVEKNGDTANVETIFGPDTRNADKFAGCVAFGDARLVLFPVRSLRGTFAFATNRLSLERLAQAAGQSWKLPSVSENHAAVAAGSEVLLQDGKSIVLEEGLYQKASDSADDPAKWISENAVGVGEYWKQRVRKNLVILSETDFQHIVTSSTIVETHTKIDDDTGTVASRHLFQAEYVPPDALFFVPVAAADPFNPKKNGITNAGDAIEQIKHWFDAKRMQTGADASTGRGMVHMRFFSVGA